MTWLERVGNSCGARVRQLASLLPRRWSAGDRPTPEASAGDRLVVQAPVPLAVCAIFKDEGAYLEEWLEFHRLVGVERFYLYDNNSSDGFRDVLAPYLARGIVQLHHWPAHPGQILAYNDCLKRHGADSRWLAFLDLDEFLYPAEDASILDVLADYAAAPALAVHWIMFSSSRHVLKPPGLVIENFTSCQHEGNRHLKLVVDPRQTERMITAHHAAFRGERLAVTESGRTATGPYATPPSIARIRINHYWTKSVEEFLVHRVRRGPVDGNTKLRDAEGLLQAERAYATGEDLAIRRFLPELKRRLAGKGESPTVVRGGEIL
jgi:hypothetical protein